jgi:hypothetical protein
VTAVIDTSIELGPHRFRTELLDLPAPGKGQDAHLAVDGFVGVADGSTPLLGSVPGSSVAQFAHRVLEALLDHTVAAREDMIREALQDLGPPAPAVEEGVSCTAALVRTHRGYLEAGVIGDCRVIARSPTTTIALTDDRLDTYDARAAELFANTIQAGGDESQARAAIDDMLLAHRRLANTPGAYWLMTGDARAATQWRWTTLPRDTQALLLCSDGFARLIEPLGTYPDDESLLRAAETQGLTALGHQLRKLESAPNSLVNAPRLSRHDDATALLLRATNHAQMGL